MTTHHSHDVETIEPLDWTAYACNCPCHPNGCRNRATHVVEIHALHRCNEPGLTFGNRVQLRCFECLLGLWVEVGHKLAALNRWGVGECGSCGAPVTQPADVVRDWRPL